MSEDVAGGVDDGSCHLLEPTIGLCYSRLDAGHPQHDMELLQVPGGTCLVFVVLSDVFNCIKAYVVDTSRLWYRQSFPIPPSIHRTTYCSHEAPVVCRVDHYKL